MFFIHQGILKKKKKNYRGFHKNITQDNCFNINNDKKFFLNTKSSCSNDFCDL